MLELSVQTERRTQLLDVTAAVDAHLRGSESLVAADIEFALERIVEEGWTWQHAAEGDRNPWAHVRAALTGSSLTIPVAEGVLALGRFQSLFLCEFDGPRERTLQLTLL